MGTLFTCVVLLFSFVGVSTAQTQVGSFLLFQGSGLDKSAHTVIPWEDGVVIGGSFLTYNDSLQLNGVAFFKDGVLSPLGAGPLLPSANSAVTAMVKVQGDLYALGRFAFPALSYQPQSVTRWTGTEWIPLPGFFEEQSNPHFAAVEYEGALVFANGRTIRRWADN